MTASASHPIAGHTGTLRRSSSNSRFKPYFTGGSQGTLIRDQNDVVDVQEYNMSTGCVG